MPILQYETRISPEGYITLPPMPDYRNRKVVVLVEAERNKLDEQIPMKKKRKATPEEARQFMDICCGCLAGLSDEEFEQMKMERILGG